MSSYRNYNRSREQENKPPARILHRTESDELLSNFPLTRLSYEVSIHKNDTQYAAAKNPNHYTYFILPKGKRCFAWATEWRRKRIVVIIDIQRPNYRNGSGGGGGGGTNGGYDYDRPFIRTFYQANRWYPGKVTMYDACFDRELVYGTVFGGVLFHNPTTDSPLFSIHTIYWYKGNPIPSLSGLQHIALCEELFSQDNIRQVAYTKENSVIFGLPVLCNTEQDAERIAATLPYEVFSIQYHSIRTTQIFQILIHGDNDRVMASTRSAPIKQPSLSQVQVIPSHSTNHNTPTPKPTPRPTHTATMKRWFVPPSDDMLTNIQAVFIVRPNIQNDIYELFVMPDASRGGRGGSGGEALFHNFALIPTFKTSVFMNRLFRNICENERLDTMEESEDEAEFENTEPDKYVTLSKEYIMTCRFNKRFCKWVPVEIATKKDVVTRQQVKQHEMRYLEWHKRIKQV